MTFNSATTLKRFWTESSKGLGHVEWIVVDNGSSDDSVAVARSLGAKTIPLGRNIGFGAANNVGYRTSQGDYVAFVNPDVEVDAATLPYLAEVANRRQTIVSPQLLNPDGTMQPNGRAMPYLSSKIMHRLRPGDAGNYRIFAGLEDEVEVDWFMGAAVVGNRDVLDKLGPWDERFFVYYEDSDLGLRASAAGMQPLLVGTVRWVHGWARDTKRVSWSAWKRELPSLVKFYSRYPRLLWQPRPLTPRRKPSV
ncbi:glycosyltransferase [Microbacterium aurantiacum]|uniref:glycosyltransferase n=1 Tax=Microbacterium aurantiacum TaxID=162393 RepID=UPI00343A39FF